MSTFISKQHIEDAYIFARNIKEVKNTYVYKDVKTMIASKTTDIEQINRCIKIAYILGNDLLEPLQKLLNYTQGKI